LNFLDNFKKILKYKIPRKSVKWEPSCSAWTDRHTERHARETDMMKWRVILRNFANVSKSWTE